MTSSSSSSSSLGLILLLMAGAAAGLELDQRSPVVRSGACQDQANLHSRLDSVEKKVEDTVGALEAELASLLEAIEDQQPHHLLNKPGEKTVEEARRVAHSSIMDGLTIA